MSELKPCPFCGSDAKTFEYKGVNGWSMICQQPECECNARIPYCHSKEEAVEQWNRRIPDPRLAALVEALKNARDFYDRLAIETDPLACATKYGPGYEPPDNKEWSEMCLSVREEIEAALAAAKEEADAR